MQIENKTMDIVVVQPLNGREAPVHVPKNPNQNKFSVVTPLLPFETEAPKVRRPIIPPRNATSLTQMAPSKNNKSVVGSYAMRFSDSTWAHSVPSTNDHYASRDEVLDVIYKYDTQLQSITGANEIERANALQCITDLLLEELSSQLRSECIERCQLVERARESYAAIFNMLQEEGDKSQKRIKELETQNTSIEENLTKVIDTSTERVNEARENCARQIDEMKAEMEAKKEEYDSSMKRFLEQKAQLEEHVKALHRVFIEFQSDSVYMTLEELKQKQESLERKLSNKDAEINKLKAQLSKLQKQLQDEESRRNLTEQANNELRKKMQTAIATTNRLQRRLDLQNMENGLENSEEEEPNTSKGPTYDLPPKEATPESTVQPHAFGSKRQKTKNSTVDPSPFIHLFHKLEKVCDCLVDLTQRAKVNQPIINDQTEKDHAEILLSGIPSLMTKEIEKKVDESLTQLELLETVDFQSVGGADGKQTAKNEPRFLQFIRSHNIEGSQHQSEQRSTLNIFAQARQILQAKYISDRWHQRMGKKPMRFPEFVVSYYSKDDENIFTALQKSARLWRVTQKTKSTEIKIFTKFLSESYTVDELSFFLEIRFALLGLPPVDDDAPSIINVPFAKCKTLLQKILGVYSPILATITLDAEKFVFSDFIDYSAFCQILLKFYRGERRKRRSAITLMFQSRKFSRGASSIDFESFVSMVQSLGYQGSMEELFEIYRESTLIGNGEITIDSLLKAMDNLSMHFYSIDTPLISSGAKSASTELSRQQLSVHWLRFGGWFEGFRRPLSNFDSWLRSKLVQQVRTVDSVFKSNAPIQTLYTEYRGLLDFFQFSLEVLARGQNDPMPTFKSERHLQLLENLIDLLVTFVVKSQNEDLGFSEAL